MAELHHLKRLLLSRYRQFAHCEIDLTDPETGTILPDLCLIGPNGSGKSTLLAELHQCMDPCAAPVTTAHDDLADALVLAKYGTDGDDRYLARPAAGVDGDILVLDPAMEESDQWETLASSPPGFDEFRTRFAGYLLDEPVPTPAPENRRAWFSPGLSLLDGRDAGDFAAFLERHLEERESHYHLYLKRPENRDKTIAEVEREFESSAPYVLTALKEIWGSLMEPCGLRFDFAQTDAPVQMSNGSSLPFDALSPAIRNLLLRLGQVYSQYFGTDLRQGSLFLDTPEEGLAPELRSALIDLYRTFLITQKAPIFVATHCPLIAAQFPPARRLRLKCLPDGSVTVSKGVAAAGSDLNRILKSDFESDLQRTAPRHSEARSSRYTQLKRAIQESENQDELADLIDEVMTMRKL
jgi:energy-coupling factor transporter ATP-binding protein EcfA2